MNYTKAQRDLSAAAIISLPNLKREDRQRWFDGVFARLESAEVQEGPAHLSPLHFNGAPVSLGALRQKVGAALGGGLSA